MTTQLRTAEERRQAILANAERLGIDEAFISVLVDTFYQRIRENEEIGPVFNHVVDDWEPHLQTMKRFWASVAMNAGSYSGKPVPKHQGLSNIQPEHFNVWLALFEETLRDMALNDETVDYFMERARRIAESLKLAMFGVPGLPQRGR